MPKSSKWSLPILKYSLYKGYLKESKGKKEEVNNWSDSVRTVNLNGVAVGSIFYQEKFLHKL
jgi:hypothetical protein